MNIRDAYRVIVNEIKPHKQKAEYKILDVINEFEKATGVIVNEISIIRKGKSVIVDTKENTIKPTFWPPNVEIGYKLSEGKKI